MTVEKKNIPTLKEKVFTIKLLPLVHGQYSRRFYCTQYGTKKFCFFGKQMITRKSSVITRKLITEGYFDDIIRSPNNPHGVMLKTGES